jgi:hypothetical protein
MMVEEDGEEIFVPIADVRCCGAELQLDRGFWRCPKCLLSYGVVTPTAPFGARCGDCPPADYPTDKTRCAPCDRRGSGISVNNRGAS